MTHIDDIQAPPLPRPTFTDPPPALAAALAEYADAGAAVDRTAQAYRDDLDGLVPDGRRDFYDSWLEAVGNHTSAWKRIAAAMPIKFPDHWFKVPNSSKYIGFVRIPDAFRNRLRIVERKELEGIIRRSFPWYSDGLPD